MENLIRQAAKALASGEVVSLPTETVYSLSANACDDRAVTEIYRMKGRKQDNPLALFVPDIATAERIVTFNKAAKILAKAFFPGPLTLVLPRKHNTQLSTMVNDGLPSLAVRMPDNGVTLAILAAVGLPIVGTSANPSGLPPATSAADVRKYFPELEVIDGGICTIGTASTIVDLCGDKPKILRHGLITPEQIADKLGA